MEISYALIAALFGLIFGSAINAMVWRLKVGRSWVKGRSVCPDCEHVLEARDLVPVLSWLSLGGKCRYCQAPIKDHPIVEVVTALAFAVSGWWYVEKLLADGPSLALTIQAVFWVVLLIMLIVLAVFDARWMILPDKVMVPLIIVAFVYSLAMAAVTGSTDALRGSLMAAVVAGGAFYALVHFSKGRAMGGGDIKLAFAMGLMLGLQATAVAMLFAFNVAAAVGIAMILAKRRGRHDHIPFGPFLAAGTIVAFLYGQTLVGWYLSMNGLL